MWELVLPNPCAERMQTQGVSAVVLVQSGKSFLKEGIYEQGRELGIGKKGLLGKEVASAKGLMKSETKGFCMEGVCVGGGVCIVHVFPLLLIGSDYLQGCCPLHMQIMESLFYL